ncbi:hypothetical protein [Parenemella sanctibonifatiensis]|uniref:Uncharacterized protein n=1 Tax=Parenemella sanctibonifatiensis TaxID=2016505 RepID=A0A255EM69_9ACTN|nr:hypothetical protein [Parenemella sanctibonifatiensis]OYN92606.1 hypothetical protein CGZ91_03790 [Parenemella sanctibonifatiensis]
MITANRVLVAIAVLGAAAVVFFAFATNSSGGQASTIYFTVLGAVVALSVAVLWWQMSRADGGIAGREWHRGPEPRFRLTDDSTPLDVPQATSEADEAEQDQHHQTQHDQTSKHA